MNQIMEGLIAFHILIGSIFVIVGSFGMVKLPDLMSRLHGPSKATTLGVGGCLVASILYFSITEDRFSTQEILITFFLFLTAPVTANFIAKAHLHTSREDQRALPPTGTTYGWSTFEKVKRERKQKPQ
jgi:multicomponent K+:H+ antiporter subunit G